MNLFVVFLSVITALLSGVVMSVCGFGAGAVSMSILPYFVPYQTAAALASMSGTFTALMVCVPNRRFVNFKILIPCAAFGVIFTRLSVLLSVNVAGSLLIKALGAALVLVSVNAVFLGDKLHVRPSFFSGAVAGAIGGTMSGLFSVGGPPIAVYMLACTKDNDVYRCTTSAHFLVTSCISTLTRWQSGIITMETFRVWLIMVVGLLVGIYLGNRIFHKLNAHRLRLIVYACLALSGITMIFK